MARQLGAALALCTLFNLCGCGGADSFDVLAGEGVSIRGDMTLYLEVPSDRHVVPTRELVDRVTRGASLVLPPCMREVSPALVWGRTTDITLAPVPNTLVGSYARVHGMTIRVTGEVGTSAACPPGAVDVRLDLPGLDRVSRELGATARVQGTRWSSGPFKVASVLVHADRTQLDRWTLTQIALVVVFGILPAGIALLLFLAHVTGPDSR